MNTKQHWEKIYQEKDPTTDVSWYQARPALSMELIRTAQLAENQSLIDVGGGASVLVDWLVDSGFSDLTVLDISVTALAYARTRLGSKASQVSWVEADITRYKPTRSFELWHDRAVFHFLTRLVDRARYRHALRRGLLVGGHVILATFAKDGPPQCSGLRVLRYDADSLCYELGPEFELIAHRRETHTTPWQSEQQFQWSLLKKIR
jgi:ubiquinone/menaquinone biosynthesis C-methylase UbiE